MDNILNEYLSPFIKLMVAILLGSLVGGERARSGKTAGLRTHALVSMGAALFVIISEIVAKNFLGETMFDPLRIASHIVVGVGFIGGGIIFLKDSRISGLTTAAGLWVAAGIGMATGFGLFILAIIATLLTLFIFIALRYVENKFNRNKKY